MSFSLNVGATPAIASFSDLQSEIAAWLDRDDLTARIPTFILMAESYFNRELRTLDMESSYTFTASAEDTSLPDDFLALRDVYLVGPPDRPLKSMSPDALRIDYGGNTGIPVAYALVSDSIRLAPVPADTTTIRIDYYQSIENLSVATPSNWLLLNHPDAYLFTALFYAETFLENPTRAAGHMAIAQGVLDSLKRSSRLSKWGTAPTPTGVAQVRNARC